MTNRELVEYIELCKGKTIIEDGARERCGVVLDSTISIRDYIDVCMGIAIEGSKNKKIKRAYINYQWEIIKNLFEKVKEEELNEAIRIITDIIGNYYVYLKYTEFERVIRGLHEHIKDKSNLELKDIKKLRTTTNCWYIRLNGKEYSISMSTTSRKGFWTIELKDVKDKNNIIEEVGAIIFKDHKREVLKIYNKKDMEDLIRELKKYRYDVALVCNDLYNMNWDKIS